MGCFIACLGGSSGCTTKKRRHLKTSPLHHHHSGFARRGYQQLESVASDRENDSDPKNEKLTLRSVLGAKKKVSFNLNVTTYEILRSNDYSQCGEEEEVPQKVENTNESASEYPSNYRYKNFIEFEDEEEDEDDEFDDCFEDCLDEESDNELDCTTNGKLDTGVSEDERSKIAHSVLMPVENTAQWRELKVKRTLAKPKHQCKENVSLDERIHTSMQQQEIRVDASLSIWINGNGHHQHNLIKAQTI